MPGLLNGKRGLVMGIANNRSIAWGIARILSEEGARIAVTYQGESLSKRVEPLTKKINCDILTSADVQDENSLNYLFEIIEKKWGSFDFLIHAIAFSDKEELNGRFVNTSRKNFLKSLDISCYSLVDLSRRCVPLMKNGGSIITLSYIGSQRVTPNYNVMGVAKAALESAVRYLSNDLGEQKIRVNAISPGPMKTLAGAAISGARQVYRTTEANSPLRSNPTLDSVGGTALYLVSDYGSYTTGEIIFVDGGYHLMGLPQLENL